MNQIIEKLKGKLVKESYSIGLDIGTSAIKIVKLKTGKDGCQLCGFSTEPASFDLEQAVKTIARNNNATIVNIGFSGPATLIRYATFLKMNPQELKQALKFEAQKHIPFPIQDVYLDGYILKSDLPENKMLVLLGAVKKEFMNQRLKLIEGAGLKVNMADIDSTALINAFNFNYPHDEKSKDRAVALLNIGATHTNFNIVEDGTPRLSRDIPIAGNILTQKIADSSGIDFKSAEAVKCNPEKSNAAKISSAIEPVLSNLAGEIRISCDYYESQSASTVEKIFLSGGSSNLQGMNDVLNALLGIDVQQWNPFKNLTISDTIENKNTEGISPQFAVAMGLALRG